MNLFINACVRGSSRTKRLADALISRFDEETVEVKLDNIDFPKVNEAFLTVRDALISKGEFSSPLFDLARQFANADRIVIAAPYWDMSFPAALKQYFEQINVLGITFDYTDDGYPVGLAKARELYYITTAGGSFVPDDYGFNYVKALSENFYGIGRVRLIGVYGLDIRGADAEAIIAEKLSAIERGDF